MIKIETLGFLNCLYFFVDVSYFSRLPRLSPDFRLLFDVFRLPDLEERLRGVEFNKRTVS